MLGRIFGFPSRSGAKNHPTRCIESSSQFLNKLAHLVYLIFVVTLIFYQIRCSKAIFALPNVQFCVGLKVSSTPRVSEGKIERERERGL